MNWFTVFYKSGYAQIVSGRQAIAAFLVPTVTVAFIMAGDQREQFVFEEGEWQRKS